MACENDTTVFVVVRHGQTAANIERRLQGQADSSLDACGLAQIRALAEHLKEDHFDFILSSDLGRAAATAAEIRRFHPDVPMELTTALREWNLGILEGMLIRDIERDYPDFAAAFRSETELPSIPGAETRAQFRGRISSFMDASAERFKGRRILLVTHGGVLQAIFHKTVGTVAPGNLYSLSDNASVSEFTHRSSGWQLTKWNENCHLRHVGKISLFTY